MSDTQPEEAVERAGGRAELIPRLITQTWRTGVLPPKAAAFAEGWRAHHPGFGYRLFDDAACVQVVAEVVPQYLDDYLGFPHPVMRADFFRYAVVYRDGGLYADIDMECLQPLEELFARETAVFSEECHLTERRRAELGYSRPLQIANCIFAAPPRHGFLMEAMHRAVELARAHGKVERDAIEDITGPRMLTRLFYERTRRDVEVLPQIYLMAPRHYPDIWPVNRNIRARHHFFGSWKAASARPLARIWIERDRWPNPWPPHRIGTQHG